MRLFAPAIAALLLACPALAGEEAPYLDDRSSPEQLVRSFYNAITRSEHARAYAYLGPFVAPDYEAFLLRYEYSRAPGVVFWELTADTRAAEIFFNLPARVELISPAGETHYEQGCIRITWPLPAHAEPPYEPMRISVMHMEPVAAGDVPPVCD